MLMRESVSNQYFLMVVPEPISFSILKKRANRSAWFIFPRLIRYFLLRHFLAKCSFHSPVHSLQSCQSRRWRKRGPRPPVGRLKNSYSRIWERNIRQIYMWTLVSWYRIIWWCMLHFNSLSIMLAYDMVDACSVDSIVIRTCAVHLKSYYET